MDFWRKHLEEPSQRLVALSLEDGRRGGGGDGVFFPGGTGGGGGKKIVGAGFGADVRVLGAGAKGQRFVSAMRDLETIEIPVPLGAWREHGRHCLANGLLHPLVLRTVCFPCVALGQIMPRVGIDWHGSPVNRLVGSLPCTNMTVVLLFWLAMNAGAAVVA